MTPEDDRPGDDPVLDPDDEQSLRDLLRSAHGAPSMPSDVAGRLDEVLAGLAAERTGSAPAVVELAERRNRRWPKVLVAAAAVSVIGLGVVNSLGNLGSGDDTRVTTAEDAAGGDARPEAATDGTTGAEPDSAPGALTKRKDTDQRLSELQRLLSASLPGDAQRLADLALPVAAVADSLRSGTASCEAPETGQGDQLFAVRLDEEPATIVFRKAENGVRQTDVYPCENPEEPAGTTFVTAK